MREVLIRVAVLPTRPPLRRSALLLALAAFALTLAPLLEVPGYELAVGLCLLLTFVGPFVAHAAIRAGARPLETTGVLLAACSPAVVWAIVHTWISTPCNPFDAFGFVPLLVVPSALLVAGLAHALRHLTARRGVVLLAWVGLILLSAVSTCWPLVFGPQVFAFNHLGGYLPGPLYDEELSIPASLLWFRVATVALALAAMAFSARRRGWAAMALLVFLSIEWRGTTLGFRATDDSVAQALGGVARFDGIVLHYPLGVQASDVERMIGDLRFRKHQLVEFFGAEPEGETRVWWYRSADEKQRLVGAANTQFAKPWRREVHVNSMGFPHPVIKHEFVHALAAPWGAPPFGVTASLAGLMPHVGVVEGFAVAADNPIDDLTLHQSCAAMKQKQLLPDVEALMTPEGFYGTAHTRAYTTAGSFLRFLAETKGKAGLRALYRDGDFQAAFGAPLDTLVEEYRRFLDGVPLDAELVNQAFGRFRRGSLFERPCAREVARISAEASDLVAIDPVRARALLERCRSVQPGEPSHVLSQAALLRRLGQRDDARTLLEAELKRLERDPSAWADAALARADLAMEEGQLELAKKLWERLVELQASPGHTRTAMVRLSSLSLPDAARDAVQRHFQLGPEDAKTLALQQVLGSTTGYAVQYLLGRRLQQAGESVLAFPVLEALSRDASLPLPVARETSRLLVEAAFSVGRCEVIETQLDDRFGPAARARAADWLERCRFSGTSPAIP